MLIKKRYIDNNIVSCPSCEIGVGTVRYKYIQDDKESRIYHCSQCDLMFARPVFIPELSHRQMDSIDDAELFNNPFLKNLHENFIIKREILTVRKILSKKDFSLLDIGCGTGWTSNIWKNEGVRVTGLEPSATRAKIAKERYGLRVIPTYIENFESPEKFDVIIMRHIIEHLENPLSVLTKVKHHLNKDGLILIIVPNIDCIGRFIFGTKWTWVLPWHCNFFNPKSTASLLNKAGFAVIKSYQMPSPLWYPDSLLKVLPFSSNFIKAFYNKLSALSFVIFVPLIALGFMSGLSDNLTIIAKSN